MKEVEYYNSYTKYWIPIIKKLYFKAKLTNDNNMVLELKENIWKNWHFTSEQRKEIWKQVTGTR